MRNQLNQLGGKTGSEEKSGSLEELMNSWVVRIVPSCCNFMADVTHSFQPLDSHLATAEFPQSVWMRCGGSICPLLSGVGERGIQLLVF